MLNAAFRLCAETRAEIPEEIPMIRKVLVAALTAAFTFATTPSFACTGISLKSGDGAAIRGRTLEFGFPLSSDVIAIPAGTAMTGTLPAGNKGIGFTTKYAMVGANAVGQTVIIDGLNDQGLSFGLFYFPGFAEYPAVTAENAVKAMAPFEFGVWVLGNFASVDELKTALAAGGAVVVDTPAPGFGSSPSHYFVRDKSGKSIVIEPLGGTLKVFDAPLGVVTNAPSYDWHLTNLRNYLNLSVTGVPPLDLDGVMLTQLGQGAGMHGLPGDFTPPSRFVRAVAFSHAEVPSATSEDAVLAAFHILNQFDIPKGSVRDKTDGGIELTQWTTVSDTKNLRWYYKTYDDQTIRVIDVNKAADAAKGQVRLIKMGLPGQPVADSSTEFESGKQADGGQ
jgi:choloylglycine hydrolase